MIAEVGSEHYDSEHYDALIMDPDQNKTPSQKKDQIEVLKGAVADTQEESPLHGV